MIDFTEQDWTDVRHMVEHGVDLPIGEVKFVEVSLDGVEVFLSGRSYRVLDESIGCCGALVDCDIFDGSSVDKIWK